MKTTKPSFVNHQGRTIRPNAYEMKAISACPGYTGQGAYMIAYASRNGVKSPRLFASISGAWRDASLCAMPELQAAAKRNCI